MSRRDSVSAASVTSDDLAEYDVVSSGLRSLESSVDDLPGRKNADIHEPPPTQDAREKFATAALTSEDIQAYVRQHVEKTANGERSSVWGHRTVRVYVDGLYDGFHTGHALQLRQAKLSFPAARLVVGVLGDAAAPNGPPALPHVERCELLRHCRWVDEVICDAPAELDEQFLLRHRVDYVAVEEGFSMEPEFTRARVKAYEHLKALGKTIPTRKTYGLAPAPLPPAPLVAQVPTPTPPATLPPSLHPAPPRSDHEGEDLRRTPRSPLQEMYEEGPLQIDIYGIGI